MVIGTSTKDSCVGRRCGGRPHALRTLSDLFLATLARGQQQQQQGPLPWKRDEQTDAVLGGEWLEQLVRRLGALDGGGGGGGHDVACQF